MEQCENPWQESCHSEDIKLYIMVHGAKHPICEECWTNLAEAELEW